MKGKRLWTKEEEEYLLKNWNKKTVEEIMKYLNRQRNSVERKAYRLGLDTRKKKENLQKRPWEDYENEIIIANYDTKTSEQISKMLKDRSANAVRKQAKKLGLAGSVRAWTDEELEILMEKWGRMTVKGIARKLGRTEYAIKNKARVLGLKDQASAGGLYYSPAEVSEIIGVNLGTLNTWIKNKVFKCTSIRIGKAKRYQITEEQILRFIETYPEKWDSTKADLSLIKAFYATFHSSDTNFYIRENIPKWLEEKIEREKLYGFKPLIREWTIKEEQELLRLAETAPAKNKYEFIAKKLDRSKESVKTKIYLLNKQKKQKTAN